MTDALPHDEEKIYFKISSRCVEIEVGSLLFCYLEYGAETLGVSLETVKCCKFDCRPEKEKESSTPVAPAKIVHWLFRSVIETFLKEQKESSKELESFKEFLHSGNYKRGIATLKHLGGFRKALEEILKMLEIPMEGLAGQWKTIKFNDEHSASF